MIVTGRELQSSPQKYVPYGPISIFPLPVQHISESEHLLANIVSLLTVGNFPNFGVFTLVTSRYFESYFFPGCDHCECDQRGALSSCQLPAPHCKPHHDLVTGVTNCDARGMKCCRMTCDGPGTMCLPQRGPFGVNSAYADLGPKTCKEGFECVKAPSRLIEKLRVN